MSGIGETNGTSYSQDTNEKLFLFKKSFKNLQNKDALCKELLLLKVQMMSDNKVESSVSSSGDPLLHYVFGFTQRPTKEAILDYYRQSCVNSDDCVELHQICQFLGEAEYAQKLAALAKLDPVLLPKTDTDIDCSVKWLGLLKARKRCTEANAQAAAEAVEQLGFLHRFHTEQKISTLSEMAARGYSWDAFVLLSLLYPNDDVTKFMGSFCQEILDLGWVTKILYLSNEEANFSKMMALGLSSLECYNVLMTSFGMNKENLYARSSIYSGVRLCLLTAAFEVDKDNTAQGMIESFLSTETLFKQECLPALQRYCFKQAFTVMHDFIHLILHISDVRKSDVFAEYEANSLGYLNNILNSWIHSGILPEDNSLDEVKRGISDVLYTFIGDVLNSSALLFSGVDYKVHVMAALRLAEVLFTNSFTRSSIFIIYDHLIEINNGEQLVNKLLEKIDVIKNRSTSITYMITTIRNCLRSVKDKFSQNTRLRIRQDVPAIPLLHDISSTEDTAVDTADVIDSSCAEPRDATIADHGDMEPGSLLSHRSSTDKELERSHVEPLEQSVISSVSVVLDKVADYDSSCPLQRDEGNTDSIVQQDDLIAQQAPNSCEQSAASATQEGSRDDDLAKSIKETPEITEKVGPITELDRMLQIPDCSVNKTFEEELRAGSDLPTNGDDTPKTELNHTVAGIAEGLNEVSVEASAVAPTTPANHNNVSATSVPHLPHHVASVTQFDHCETPKNSYVSRFSDKFEHEEHQGGRPPSTNGYNKNGFNSANSNVSNGNNRGHYNYNGNRGSNNGYSNHQNGQWNQEHPNQSGGRGNGFNNRRPGGFAGNREPGRNNSGGYRQNDQDHYNGGGGGRSGGRNNYGGNQNHHNEGGSGSFSRGGYGQNRGVGERKEQN